MHSYIEEEFRGSEDVLHESILGVGYMKNGTTSEKFREMYQGLQDTVGIPIQVLHVVRNPYDMITTVVFYNALDKHEVKVEANQEHKFISSVLLRNAVANVLFCKG